MKGSVRVGVGTCIFMGGQRLTVVEIGGNRVVLRDDLNGYRTATVSEAIQQMQEPVTIQDPRPEEHQSVDHDAQAKLNHVREVETGYRSGTPLITEPGEPRSDYRPGVALRKRHEAKAQELGVDRRTVQNWVNAYRKHGLPGLTDGRKAQTFELFAGLDERWLDVARQVIDEHISESKPSKKMQLTRIHARLDRDHGPGVVPEPRKTRAYEVLHELARGTGAFSGSAKAKRSIANRPDATFSGLRATSPLQFLLFDTTRLDVFAMDPITMTWVQVEFTVAIDLYSRCIVGMRLTPVSTKALDIARVLHDVLQPTGIPEHWPETARWPYGGIPGACVFNPDHVTQQPTTMTRPDTVVIDHGKQYVSEHFVSACERLGVSIQPARPYTPTDKAVVERFFRTLRSGLLEALPGYKGPDVYSRGERPEQDAFFFIDELDEIVREWIACVYHLRPHSSLVDPHVPGLKLSPAQMFDHGIARVGYLEVPADPHMGKHLLRIEWRSVHHYGVDIDGFRYAGEIVSQLQNTTSPYRGVHPGDWPFYVDDDDRASVWFYHKPANAWHRLKWVHADALNAPFSKEAVEFARSLAKTKGTKFDDRLALAELLDRWNVGLAASPKDRRLALRHLSTLHADRSATTAEASQTYVEQVTQLMGDGQQVIEEPDEVLEAGPWPDVSQDYYDDALGDQW